MFYKRLIEKQQNQINEFQKEVDSLQFTNSDLKESFDKILDTLEGDNFSKDWEEFNKYKQLRGKLPIFEVMVQINRLKELFETIKSQEKNLDGLKSIYIAQMATSSGNRMASIAKDFKIGLDYFNNNIIDSHKKVDEILDSLRQYNNIEQMLELFNIYAISEDWLRP